MFPLRGVICLFLSDLQRLEGAQAMMWDPDTSQDFQSRKGAC